MTGRELVYIDWRESLLKDFEPQHQQDTSTCWAFAIALCVSLLAVIEHGVPDDGLWKLSVQELVDRVCHTYKREDLQPKNIFKQDDYFTYGTCNKFAFLYCQTYGLSYEHHYPFVGRRNLGKSMPAEDELPRVYISDFDLISGPASKHMNTVINFLAEQPLVGKLYATKEFRESKYCYKGHKSGIEHLTETEHGVVDTEAHSVVIVGYVGKLDCFIILNSWGKSFGDEGYLLVASKLMFDVGRPKVSFKVNRRLEYRKTNLPRKCQFSEYVISTAGSNPPEVATDLILEKERLKRDIVLKANGLRMSKTVATAENLQTWIVSEVRRPLHKSFRILAQSLQHIQKTALETSGKIQSTGGRQPAFLRASSQRLCRGFKDSVNGFVDDGGLILSNDSMEDVTIVINSNAEKFVGSQYSSTLLMLPTFGGVGCAKASTLLQDVPLAVLLHFPREHRSDWADYAVNAYFAASLKASLCTITYARPGGFSGTTVILPLTYTVKHEEFFEVVRPEGHAFSPEDMALSRDMYLLQWQEQPSADRSTLEMRSGGACPYGEADLSNCNLHPELTIAFQCTCENHLGYNKAVIARHYVRSLMGSIQINTHMGSKQLSGCNGYWTLLLWICRTCRVCVWSMSRVKVIAWKVLNDDNSCSGFYYPELVLLLMF